MVTEVLVVPDCSTTVTTVTFSLYPLSTSVYVGTLIVAAWEVPVITQVEVPEMSVV
jgi:hypothetical protein